MWLGGLAFGLFLTTFAVSFRHLPSAGDNSIWPMLSMVGAILIVAIGGAGSVFWLVAAYLVPIGLSDDSIRILFAGDQLAFTSIAPWAMALFSGAAAISIRNTQSLPRWLAGLGFAVSGLLLIGTAWLFGSNPEGPLAIVGFAALVLWTSWALATSVLMIRGNVPADIAEADHVRTAWPPTPRQDRPRTNPFHTRTHSVRSGRVWREAGLSGR